jgi:hypothetical protein
LRPSTILVAATFLAASLTAGAARAEESSRAVICAVIDRAAATHSLPASFLTRLIWRESSFRPQAVSPVGARGIAQFMPATASARGLTDPFDPEAAIPASASYLSELRGSFGSLDLAAAAYNAGPGRIARWRSGEASLPDETRAHVRFVTGANLTADARDGDAGRHADTGANCLATLAAIQASNPRETRSALAEAIAPWGVQLVAGPNKARALDDYRALQGRVGALLTGHQPTVITTRLGGRGARSYYRIRVAFDDRASADRLCRRMRSGGAACLTVRN